jgi:multiple sugar transport system ATP-binding protein
MATVSFRSLVKAYEELEVVHGINLDVADGEFVVLVGPSGCGKSTSLRMLAGLEDTSGGEILINDKVVNEVAPRDRDVAMVFQDYALYPHMTVFENMAFSLRYRKTPKAEITSRVMEAADILGLEPLLQRRPKQLSGGQRQRVAMGRAIVRKPQVFLFDEPLSNLDAKLRGSMRLEMKKLHRRLGVTTLYVTHDQIEAMTLADRVVVMNNGHIDQVGTPDEVYKSPKTLFVAGFIGSPTMNVLPAKRDADGSVRVGGAGGFSIDHSDIPADAPQDLVFGIRPEEVFVGESIVDDKGPVVTAIVDVVEAQGPDTLVFANLGGHDLTIRTRPDIKVRAGDAVQVQLNISRSHLFNKETGRTL